MSGVVWACLAGVGFGLFQTANRVALAGLDVLRSTFIQLVVSVLILGGISLVTEDLGDLRTMPISAVMNFSAAGLIHFFVGWTLLNASQKRLGATRTSPLIATTPMFGAAIAAVTLDEVPGLGSVLGIALIIAGVNAVGTERRPRAPASDVGSPAPGGPGFTPQPSAAQAAPPASGDHGEALPWTAYLFGLGTALCWAVSPIFTRRGLEDADSPLLGVTVGLAAAVLVYAVALASGRRVRSPGRRVPRAAMSWKLVAGVLCGLSTWSRWSALSLTPVAVVLGLGLLSVPTVAVLAPLAVGRDAERVTPRLLAGMALVLCGALVLIVRG